MEGISDGLRLELHEFGIAVTTLEPGIVSSPLVGKMHASVPNLNGTVDEVNETACFQAFVCNIALVIVCTERALAGTASASGCWVARSRLFLNVSLK